MCLHLLEHANIFKCVDEWKIAKASFSVCDNAYESHLKGKHDHFAVESTCGERDTVVKTTV